MASPNRATDRPGPRPPINDEWVRAAGACFSRACCAPFSRRVRSVLERAFDDAQVLGTYDHLRSPFANRLAAGDLRFAHLLASLDVPGTSLLLDILAAPGQRRSGCSRGLASGLGLFSRRLDSLDWLGSPSVFVHRQAGVRTSMLDEDTIRTKVGEASLTMLRELGVNRVCAIRAAASIRNRAETLAGVYRAVHGMPATEALIRLRKGVFSLIGLPPPAFKQIPLSGLLPLFADAIEAAAADGCDLTRVPLSSLTATGLFAWLSESGRKVGTVVPERLGGFLVLGRTCFRISFEQLLRALADGLAVPSTLVVYALLHRLGGYPSFGDSHALDRALHGWPGLPRNSLALTPDGVSTPTVGLIRVRNRVHRHLNVDLLVHSNTTLRESICSAALTGQRSYDIDIRHWAQTECVG